MACCLNFRLVPYRHNDGGKCLGVFLRGGFSLVVIAGIQIFQRFLAFGFILDQLNQAVFLVVALIDLSVDRRHAFGSSFYSVFVNGRIRVGFAARLCAGDLRFDLLSDGLKATRFFRSQMILDLNGLAGVDEFLQTNLVFFGEKTILSLLQQPLDLRVHLIQRLDVCRQSL